MIINFGEPRASTFQTKKAENIIIYIICKSIKFLLLFDDLSFTSIFRTSIFEVG